MAPHEHLAAARRVLIIRPSALGDVSRTVPALVSLCLAMPQARIDWLVNEGFADAVRYHPALAGVVPFARRRLAAMLRSPAVAREARAFLSSLREARYDLVFDLQGLLRSGFFAWTTRAPRRVGFADAAELGWMGCNRRHRIDPELHTVDRMLTLVEAEGVAAVRDMRLYVGAEDRRWADAYLAERSIKAGGYFTIAPTARWLCKCWPIERYVQVVRRLLDTGLAGSAGVILAAPSEREQIRPLIEALGAGAPMHVPQTTVGQMMALLSRTSLLVCNDSAPLHIAVGFDRPIVSIFGPTDPKRVGPYRRPDAVLEPEELRGVRRVDYRHRREDQSIIAGVSFDRVWDAVQAQRQAPQLGLPEV